MATHVLRCNDAAAKDRERAGAEEPDDVDAVHAVAHGAWAGHVSKTAQRCEPLGKRPGKRLTPLQAACAVRKRQHVASAACRAQAEMQGAGAGAQNAGC